MGENAGAWRSKIAGKRDKNYFNCNLWIVWERGEFFIWHKLRYNLSPSEES